MKRVIHLLSGVSLIASGVWLWFARDAESLQTVVGSIIAFFSSFSQEDSGASDQLRRVGRKSTLRKAANCLVSVRKILTENPGYGHTEDLIHQEANRMHPQEFSLQQVRDAIDKNHKQSLIRSETNEADGTALWFITSAGIARNKQDSD